MIILWHSSRRTKKLLTIRSSSLWEIMDPEKRIGELRLGQYENLNPFLMVIIPAVYRNTAIHTQVKKKTHELMTNFDLHATLMDILKVCVSRLMTWLIKYVFALSFNY
ncbi:hypothetical protein ANCCAN_09530 [Ancylostoma caninum]|uniref:Uncharacterized protein n=1 Tax=Ancylostoma caninum TaxID=29170 RepID=A0A368GJ95_ANCCA|nr:hypothetical protein ANCCAN_09530 [Ancylostoma caninum]